MSVDYKKIGEAIGKAQAQSLVVADSKIEEMRDALRVEMRDTVDKLRKSFEQLNQSTLKKGDDTFNAFMEMHSDHVLSLTAQIKSQEVFEAQLTARIAEIKDGEKGDQGEQGEPGLDRPLLEPVDLVAQKDYPKSTLGTFNNGLWISVKDTLGTPHDDPHAWSCILDAMTSLSVDMQEDRTYKLSCRLGSGKMLEDTFKIPFQEHKGIWEEGEYLKGDIVTKGSSLWQAMEETNGEPPGNGWKKILSAPRGGRGAEGKSIIGPQGKPGRNGMDAKLPDGFLDELVRLSTERKAFEDNRSAAEAITSFRGYFSPEESYSRGDVVNHDGNLYLTVTGGAYASIAQSGGAFELMLGVPKYLQTAYMDWHGEWQQKQYKRGQVVTDSGWAMVCVNPAGTTDRAAPQPIGLPTNIYSGTMSDDSVVASQVIFGNRYLNTDNAILAKAYRVYAKAGHSYSIYSVTNPETTPVATEIGSFTASEDGWRTENVSTIIVAPSTVFDLVAVVHAPIPVPVEWSGTWNYSAPGNPQNVGNGDYFQPGNAIDEHWVSKTDSLGADQSSDLEAVTIGDIVTDGVIEWNVQSVVDEGTWMRFTVTPATQSIVGNNKLFTFTTVTPTATEYGLDTDYWQTAGSLNQGLFAVDSDYESITPDETAYGIDLVVQNTYISPDWEVLAYSGDVATVSADTTSTKFVLGWGNYTDSETSPATQVVTTTPQKLSIDGTDPTTVTDYLPGEILGSGQLWDGVNNKITPIGLGDGYTLRIDLEVIAETSNPNELIFQLDISGNATPDTPIVQRIVSGGKTTPYTLSIGFPIFALDTFIANGGQIFLSTDTGSFEVASRNITIHRISRGGS